MSEAYCRDTDDLAGKIVKYFIIAGGEGEYHALRDKHLWDNKTDRMTLHVRMNKGLP